MVIPVLCKSYRKKDVFWMCLDRKSYISFSERED